MFKIAQGAGFLVVRIAHLGDLICGFSSKTASIKEEWDFKVAVVIDVSELPKFIHEVTHAGARRADHVRERLLADFGDHRLALSVLPKVRQQ